MQRNFDRTRNEIPWILNSTIDSTLLSMTVRVYTVLVVHSVHWASVSWYDRYPAAAMIVHVIQIALLPLASPCSAAPRSRMCKCSLSSVASPGLPLFCRSTLSHVQAFALKCCLPWPPLVLPLHALACASVRSQVLPPLASPCSAAPRSRMCKRLLSSVASPDLPLFCRSTLSHVQAFALKCCLPWPPLVLPLHALACASVCSQVLPPLTCHWSAALHFLVLKRATTFKARFLSFSCHPTVSALDVFMYNFEGMALK